MYVIGGTASDDILPVSTDPSFKAYAGNFDVFVAKFSPDGQLVYFTYLGGSLNDFGYAIAVDSFGRAYVTGRTRSNNFPTQGANADNECGVDNSCGLSPSDHDAFVIWLNSSGNALIFSTFLGGGNPDQGNGIAVDMGGNVHVTGFTESSNFPGQNCFGEESGAPGGVGDRNAFVGKYDSTTSTIYSCYLGGSLTDEGNDIAVDPSGQAHVTGYTMSSDFPTHNAFQDSSGYKDVFVTGVNTTGDSLVYSTYLGGGSGKGIAVDGSGYPYVTGDTLGSFPTTSGVFRTSPADIFVTKLNPGTQSLIYSTYFGSDGAGDTAEDIAIDSAGNAYITGRASTEVFPQKNPLFGSSCDGSAYVAKFNPTATRLVYSTCIGGDENFDSDFGLGIAVDSNGAAWVAGHIEVDDLSTTPNAFQPDFDNSSGQGEGFFVQITESIRAVFEGPLAGAVSGVALVRGWAFDIFDDESISEVSFFINDIQNTTIPCCSARKDIQSAFPDFPETNTLNSGWGLTLNWGDLEAGPHEVYVRITSTTGDVWESETRTVNVIKPANSPFLDMFVPSPFDFDASLSDGGLVLRDVFVRDKFTQVESLVDVRYLFDETTQGLGLVESTVAQAPLLKRWYASLERQLVHWWSEVTLLVPVHADITSSTASFEAPLIGPVQGISLVRGWSFDTLPGETIDLVELLIDGVLNTTIPCCSERQDVANANPSFPPANTLNSGWGLTLNWGDLSAGDHTVQIQLTSSTGQEFPLGTRTVMVVKLGDFPFIDDFDVSAASVSIDEQDIVLTGVIVQDKATKALANITLRLRWSEPAQALTIISAAPVS